jgi:uncharacterized ferredoxin-like protein
MHRWRNNSIKKDMILEEQIRKETVLQIAQKMLTAARTAPKARGVDRLFLAILEPEEIQIIAKEMVFTAQNGGPAFFERDAGNLLQADTAIILGTKYESQGLQLCGYCGFGNCESKNNNPDVPCVFNTGDLGIAIGSAVSVAMDHRIDNRILYSGGYIAIKTKLTPSEVKLAYVVPLSVSAKNPFFDRK